MTPNPIAITPENRAIDALRAMSDGGFRHLPVIEDGSGASSRAVISRGWRSID
jgi:CBS domain-containing protein